MVFTNVVKVRLWEWEDNVAFSLRNGKSVVFSESTKDSCSGNVNGVCVCMYVRIPMLFAMVLTPPNEGIQRIPRNDSKYLAWVNSVPFAKNSELELELLIKVGKISHCLSFIFTVSMPFSSTRMKLSKDWPEPLAYVWCWEDSSDQNTTRPAKLFLKEGTFNITF